MGTKVLVVDDNGDIARITERYLSASGFEVATAFGGKEALARVASDRPDCILLDVMMPDMSGLDVLDRLRDDPATAAIPIILVTARVEDTDVQQGYRKGADYYITKPFGASQIVNGVRLVLSRHPAPERVARASS